MARAANGLAWMFVELETNAGITGIAYSEGAGPVRAFIHEQLSDLVVGADPFETEKIWNDMLHPAMATPNLMVVEMLGIEWDPMVKWLVDPPMPDGGYWKPDAERPGNGIELNPHAVAQYKLD